MRLLPGPSVLSKWTPRRSWRKLARPDQNRHPEPNAPWNSLRAKRRPRWYWPDDAAPSPACRGAGAKPNPVDEFDFEEDADGSDHTKYAEQRGLRDGRKHRNRSPSKHYGWCTIR